MSLRRTAFLLATLVAVGAVASGCGRRGAPITPYEAAVDERKAAQEAGRPVPPEPRKPPEDKRFILDGLID